MISIITAHYNSSEKINNLIASLQKQSDKDFEWIVVDDCSCDEEFMSMKTKVLNAGVNAQVLKTEKNGGPGIARNVGIKNCAGDYITFVDCDDAVSNDFVMKLCHAANEKKADVIIFDYVRIQKSRWENCAKIDYEDQGYVNVSAFLLKAKTCVWCGLYKRDMIIQQKIEFPQLYRFEDWVFNVIIAVNTQDIWYIKEPLYFYIEAEDSLVTSGKHDAGEYAIKAFDIIEPILKKYDANILQQLFVREILYVNAIRKAKKLKLREYKFLMKNLVNDERCANLQHIDKSAFSKHQYIIVLLLRKKMYSAIWILGRII